MKRGVVLLAGACVAAITVLPAPPSSAASPVCPLGSFLTLTAGTTIVGGTEYQPNDSYHGAAVLHDGLFAAGTAATNWVPAKVWAIGFSNAATANLSFPSSQVASVWLYGQKDASGTVTVNGSSVALPSDDWVQVPGLSGTMASLAVSRDASSENITEIKVCATTGGGTPPTLLKEVSVDGGQTYAQVQSIQPPGPTTTLTWRIRVTAGSQALTGVTVQDASYPACSFTVTSLSAGQTQTQVCPPQTVPSPPNTTVTNTASIGAPYNVASESKVNFEINGGNNSLVIYKDARVDPTAPFQQVIAIPPSTSPVTITWRVRAIATGTTFTNVVVSDVAFPACGGPIPVVAPGAPIERICTQTIASAANGATFENTATFNSPYVGFSTAKVIVGNLQPPNLSIKKEVSLNPSGPFLPSVTVPTSPSDIPVTWKVTVTATGPTGHTFNQVVVLDPTNPQCAWTIPSLVAGQSDSKTCPQNIEGKAGTTTNAASIQGLAGATAAATVTVTPTVTSEWHFAPGLPGTPECNGATAPGPAIGGSPATWTVCIPFEGRQRVATVDSFDYSFGTRPVPDATKFVVDKPWQPPSAAATAGLLTICPTDRHDQYWSEGPDDFYYPTWHPATDTYVSGGTTVSCTYGHEHGDDPRSSSLFHWSGGMPFGYADNVYNRTATTPRKEDHVGHKVVVQNLWNTARGEPQDGPSGPNTPELSPGGFSCYWLSHIHQGVHSDDALNHNDHEYFLNAMCDDLWETDQTRPGEGVGATEVRLKLLATFGEPGAFNDNCQGDDTPTVAYSANAGVPPEGLPSYHGDDKRSLPCPDPAFADQTKDRPLVAFNPAVKDPAHGMEHQNHYHFNQDNDVDINRRLEEVWKPGATLTKAGHGSAFIDSSAYYIVLNPARLVNKMAPTTLMPFWNIDREPGPNWTWVGPNGLESFDPVLSTIDLCMMDGPLKDHVFCDAVTPGARVALEPMTHEERKVSPLNPFNGSQRVVHPKRIQVYNQGEASNYCSNAVGREAVEAPPSGCTITQIAQYARPRSNGSSWSGLNGSVINSNQPTWTTPGVSTATNDTVVDPASLQTVGGNWGREHEWVRIYDGQPLVPQNLTGGSTGLLRAGKKVTDTVYADGVSSLWSASTIGEIRVQLDAPKSVTPGTGTRSIRLTGTASRTGIRFVRSSNLATKGGSVRLMLRASQATTVTLQACSDRWCIGKRSVAVELKTPNQWITVTVPMSQLGYFSSLGGLEVLTSTTTAPGFTLDLDQIEFLTA